MALHSSFAARKNLPDNSVVNGAVCRTSKSDGHQALCTALRAAGYDIEPSKCLGVCIGPVVAAPIRDAVISEVRGAETIHDLTLAISQGKTRSLRHRKVRGGTRDKARRKALQAAQR